MLDPVCEEIHNPVRRAEVRRVQSCPGNAVGEWADVWDLVDDLEREEVGCSRGQPRDRESLGQTCGSWCGFVGDRDR